MTAVSETDLETELSSEFQRVIERAPAGRRSSMRDGLQKLQAYGIRSFEELAAALPGLEGDALTTAIWALPDFDKRRSLPLIRRLLRSSDAHLRANLLRALDMTQSTQAARIFADYMSDPDARVRESAAHGLGFLFQSRYDAIAYPPLLMALQDEAEDVAVRGQCAEGLGNILDYPDDDASSESVESYRRGEAALLPALDHSDPRFRFWAVFALGSMRSQAALPRLREIEATDTAVCPLWWSVQDEASDAIQCILTGNWPDVERVQQR